MASINKLSVRGIRAFSPDDEEQCIEFFYPCTIILGQNGCGKTTIIEAIKFAITGALPPGSKSGSSFVHDPKSIGHTTVKANLKLRFTSRANQTMVVVRSMEVTQRKIKATFKQLDGVLRTMDPDTGERVSLSHKCGELDKQIPSLLGVSKAILEHVVFCHQEDASWPLQESAALKKRFDDIFDSTKYSKALKAFRDTEKEYLGKAKNLEVDVASIASHRHAAKGFRKELQEQHDRMDILTESKQTMEQQVTDLVQAMEAARATLNALEEANGVMDAKSIELDQEERLVAEKRRLVEQDLSSRGITTLQGELRDFDTTMQQEVQRQTALSDRAIALQQALEALHAQEREQSSHYGKLQAEQEAHASKLKERFTMMERIAREFALDLTQASQGTIAASLSQSMSMAFDDDDDMTVLTMTADDMRGFFEGMQAKEDELAAAVQEHTARARAEEGTLQAGINELNSKVQTERNAIDQLRTEQVQSENQVRELKESIGSSRMRKTEVEDYRRRAIQAAQERDQASSNPRIAAIKPEITQLERKIEDTKRTIEDEMIVVERLKTSVATQNTIATLRDQCDKDIGTLEETISDESYSISKFGIQAPASLPRDQDETGEALAELVDAMEKSARGKLSQASAQLKQAEEAFLDSQKGVSEITAMLHSTQKAQNTARTKLQALSKTEDEFKATVAQVQEYGASNNAPFDGNAEDPSAVMRHLDRQIEAVEALLVADAPKLAKRIAKRLAKELQGKYGADRNKVTCPCCKNSITEVELDTFLEEVYEMTRQTVPQQGGDVAAQKQMKNTYQALRKAIESQKDNLRDVDRLRQELSTHEKEGKRLQDELARLSSEHKQRQQDKTNAQSGEKDLRALLESIRRWNSEADRIASNKQLIIQKKQALAAAGHNSDRDLDTVEKQVAQLREEKDNYAIEVSRRQKEATELSEHANRLAKRASDIEREANEKEKKFENERLAIQKKAELTERIKEIVKQEGEAKERLNQLEQKEKKRKAELARTRELFSGEQEGLSSKYNSFKTHKQVLKSLSKEIEKFESSSKSSELENMESKRNKILSKREKTKKEYDELKPQLEQLTKAVDDQERHKKMLEDNISILQSEERIKELSEEIRGLEAKRDSIGGSDDLKRYDELVAEREVLLQKKARTDGLFSSHMEQIRSLKRKLLSPEYKDVDEEYRVAKIKHSTTKLAAQDLKKYGNALDKALLQFHGVKIKEINKIIKELWMMCYRGQDITNIEIQSGQEEGSTASKSYNYRVVMTKGGAKMDMRGRCSAGQRVLTSIVIRLALAETFGLNCGCIALDEPTVNLDEKNKEGLAVSLAHIIESRARQRNFQLLLITHDEEFIKKLKLELMTMTGFSMPEKYFNVCREMASDGKYYSKIESLGWEDL